MSTNTIRVDHAVGHGRPLASRNLRNMHSVMHDELAVTANNRSTQLAKEPLVNLIRHHAEYTVHHDLTAMACSVRLCLENAHYSAKTACIIDSDNDRSLMKISTHISHSGSINMRAYTCLPTLASSTPDA